MQEEEGGGCRGEGAPQVNANMVHLMYGHVWRLQQVTANTSAAL